MTTDHTTRIFVITLPHAVERQETIRSRLGELGLDFEFIEGVDGRKLDLGAHPNYAPLKRRLFYGRDLSGGEFGCILAHRRVYEHMVNLKIERALVLEDDAILADELPAVLAALGELGENWDLVRFLGREKNYRSTRKIAPLNGAGASLARQLGIPGGAYGYLLNLRAAVRLEELTRRNWLAIDTLHGATWQTRLRTFAIMPSPVLPNDLSPSCIDTQDDNLRWDKSVKLNGWMRLVYPITRGAWKLYLNCWSASLKLATLRQDQRLAKQLKR
ncbi:MAG: glycosyltransferase family 25 protein [Geothermobacteraceae bacterium]